jgi:hypothetical protein
MRWRGVCHVEFAVLDYGESVAFYDALFGWLGYSSFSSLNMEYESTYYMTRHLNRIAKSASSPPAPGGGSRTPTKRLPAVLAWVLCGVLDDPINGIHWELAWLPKVPMPRQLWAFHRAIRGYAGSRPDMANTVGNAMRQARRRLPARRSEPSGCVVPDDLPQ